MTTRFLADENFPAATVHALRLAGHDVAYIADSDTGADDAQVLRAAVETSRVLLTCDKDFGALVFHAAQAAGPGLILVRISTTDLREFTAKVLKVLATDIQWEGHFAVVTTNGVRRRRLPTG